MQQYVEIEFDCLPLRSVGRLDIPMDASPKYRARCERIKLALETHGSHNAYFLYNAQCTFHLTNEPELGMIQYRFEGTALTDASDQKTLRCDLHVELARETCDWLTQPVASWLSESVTKAVEVEFDRFIAAGDLAQTIKRIEQLQAKATNGAGSWACIFSACCVICYATSVFLGPASFPLCFLIAQFRALCATGMSGQYGTPAGSLTIGRNLRSLTIESSIHGLPNCRRAV
jgi:hypothetical protein